MTDCCELDAIKVAELPLPLPSSSVVDVTDCCELESEGVIEVDVAELSLPLPPSSSELDDIDGCELVPVEIDVTKPLLPLPPLSDVDVTNCCELESVRVIEVDVAELPLPPLSSELDEIDCCELVSVGADVAELPLPLPSSSEVDADTDADDCVLDAVEVSERVSELEEMEVVSPFPLPSSLLTLGPVMEVDCCDALEVESL